MMMRKIVVIFLTVALCMLFMSCSNEKPQTITIQEEWLGNFDGKEIITLDELRALAAKGEALSFEDLAPVYKWINFSSTMGNYNMVFSVEGGYRLQALAEQDKKINHISLQRIWDENVGGIDIRYNDVDKFIKTNPSHPALTVDEMKVLAQNYSENGVTLIEFEWWEYVDESPHHCKDPAKQELRESLDALCDTEEATLEMFTDTAGAFFAVCRKNGNVYLYDKEINEIPTWKLQTGVIE